jgi:hypothetical protein
MGGNYPWNTVFYRVDRIFHCFLSRKVVLLSHNQLV